MAFLDRADERLLADGLDVVVRVALVETVFLRLAILARQIGDDVGVAATPPSQRVPATPRRRNQPPNQTGGLVYRATRASRQPSATRRRSHAHHASQIRAVAGRPVGQGDFHADSGRFIAVAVNQFRPKLGADLFLRVGVAFGVVDRDVEDFLLFAFAGEFGVAVGDGAFEKSHIETHC